MLSDASRLSAGQVKSEDFVDNDAQSGPRKPGSGNAMLPQQLILASRWLLLVFYAVLILALAFYALAFVVHFVELMPKIVGMSEDDVILQMLGLVDAALVASLVVMVVISGYDNFIWPIATEAEGLSWIGNLDTGGLKIKIAASIVAITSIRLLEVMLNVSHYTNEQIAWAAGLHLTFVVSAIGLGIVERLTRH
jgi:uncharacterized protein (TIGR00645 family)